VCRCHSGGDGAFLQSTTRAGGRGVGGCVAVGCEGYVFVGDVFVNCVKAVSFSDDRFKFVCAYAKGSPVSIRLSMELWGNRQRIICGNPILF
jgi:hypothetical protein